jgi:hypothetical protein
MMEAALENRRWVWRDLPFPFLTATNVFTPAVYEGMVAGFRDVLARGLRDSGRIQDAFTRNMAGYDAYSYIFTNADKGPLALFASQEWHDLLASVFRIEATGGVSIALHHHQAGGKNGRPHNDLNPGWFIDMPQGTKPGTINVQDPAINSYPTGRCYVANGTCHETVRAIAVLFYLNNPSWKEGDGGETGLYRAVNYAAEDAAVRVPPVNNSLLAFECSPWSYHGFIQNRAHSRDSVIMWLHRPKVDVVRRWGEHSIVGWK